MSDFRFWIGPAPPPPPGVPGPVFSFPDRAEDFPRRCRFAPRRPGTGPALRAPAPALLSPSLRCPVVWPLCSGVPGSEHGAGVEVGREEDGEAADPDAEQ